MPRILGFLCCEKVLFDTSEGNLLSAGNDLFSRESLSLIALLQGVRMAHPPGPLPTFPENTIMGFNWGAVSVWVRSDGDGESLDFEQRIVLKASDGTILLEAMSPVSFKPGNVQARHFFRAGGIPIWKPGKCSLRLDYRLNESQKWECVSDAPFNIEFVEVKES